MQTNAPNPSVVWVKTVTERSGRFTSGLVTSPPFRSPPVRSHDGRSGSPFSRLSLPPFPGSLTSPPEPGSPARRPAAAAVTALLSVSPQQEGLDDGPDFLSEEERGVSVSV